MQLNITMERMLLDINNYLTGQLESATCSGSYSFDPNEYYVECKNWKKADGSIAPLIIKGSVYIQAYNNYGTSKPIDWGGKMHPTFVERFWKYIKGLD